MPSKPGSFRGETKWRAFQIPCEMQLGLDLLRPDYTKERHKRKRRNSFGVWRHSSTKKMALGRIAVAFCRDVLTSTMRCANQYSHFVSPSTAAWLTLTELAKSCCLPIQMICNTFGRLLLPYFGFVHTPSTNKPWAIFC